MIKNLNEVRIQSLEEDLIFNRNIEDFFIVLKGEWREYGEVCSFSSWNLRVFLV